MFKEMATNDFLCFEQLIHQVDKYYFEYINLENVVSILNCKFKHYGIYKMFCLLDDNYSLFFIMFLINCCNSDIEIYGLLAQLEYDNLLLLTLPINKISKYCNYELNIDAEKDLKEISSNFTQIIRSIYITGTESEINFNI